ncbi:hypothetical protein ACVII1_002352 [Bradyrhizobium elkanii]
MTLNNVSTSTPKATQANGSLVVRQDRSDEAKDRGERAGGFLGGEDDEVLVIIVVIELELVVRVLILFVVSRRRGWLCGGGRRGRTGRGLLLQLGIVGRRSRRIV